MSSSSCRCAVSVDLHVWTMERPGRARVRACSQVVECADAEVSEALLLWIDGCPGIWGRGTTCPVFRGASGLLGGSVTVSQSASIATVIRNFRRHEGHDGGRVRTCTRGLREPSMAFTSMNSGIAPLLPKARFQSKFCRCHGCRVIPPKNYQNRLKKNYPSQLTHSQAPASVLYVLRSPDPKLVHHPRAAQ